MNIAACVLLQYVSQACAFSISFYFVMQPYTTWHDIHSFKAHPQIQSTENQGVHFWCRLRSRILSKLAIWMDFLSLQDPLVLLGMLWIKRDSSNLYTGIHGMKCYTLTKTKLHTHDQCSALLTDSSLSMKVWEERSIHVQCADCRLYVWLVKISY